MTKNITVELDGKSVIIKKLPLGKYAELLDAIETLPEQIGGLEGITNDEIFARLPKIIAKSLPEVIKIISIATDMPKEDVEQLGLHEVIRILKGIGEANNYAEVLDLIKKALASQKGTPKAK